jgi:hypothetical protein
LNHQEGKSKFIGGVRAMFLGFLPWTLFESLRELGDWWAFCDELESFEKKQSKLNEKLTQPLKFDQSRD